MKNTLISLAIATTMAFASTAAFAEATGEAKVREAAENALAKIEEAVGVMEKSGDSKEIVRLINEARQIQKDFRYEVTERQRQKVGDKLRIARDNFESGDKKVGEEKLRAALHDFKEIKDIYDANH